MMYVIRKIFFCCVASFVMFYVYIWFGVVVVSDGFVWVWGVC